MDPGQGVSHLRFHVILVHIRDEALTSRRKQMAKDRAAKKQQEAKDASTDTSSKGQQQPEQGQS